MTDVKIKGKRADAGSLMFRIFICIFGPLTVFGYSYYLNNTTEEMVRNVILMTACSGMLVMSFSNCLHKGRGMFPYNLNTRRFFIVFLFGLAVMVMSVYIPPSCLPFLPVAVALSMCSNEVTGLTGYVTFVMMATFLSDMDVSWMMLYLFVGLMTIVFFQGMGRTYRYRIPLFCSVLMLIVFETAVIMLQRQTHFYLEEFVYLMINAFVSVLSCFLFLKYFSYRVIHRHQDLYRQISRPEYSLLMLFKENAPKDYRLAIHTAHFCERIAEKLDVDPYLTKAAAMYYRIGKLREGDVLVNSYAIAKEYRFPAELTDLIAESVLSPVRVHSRESAIVMLADAVVTSVTFMFEKNPEATPDYEQVVGVVLKKKIEKGVLDECKLTMADYAVIKRTLVEEKIYYDFLH